MPVLFYSVLLKSYNYGQENELFHATSLVAGKIISQRIIYLSLFLKMTIAVTFENYLI